MPQELSSESQVDVVTTSTSEASQTTGTQGDKVGEAKQQSETAASSDVKQPAATSTAPSDKDVKQTPLDVVRKVMTESRQTAEQKVEKQTERSSESAKEGDQKSDQSTDGTEKLSPKARENFKALETDRDKYREQATQFQDKATRYDTLSGFLTESGITGEDFSSMLKIGRAMKQDPKVAYDMLAPVMQGLELQLGLRLPNDLQQRVTDGLDSEETARNLAIARARQQAAEQSRAEADRRAQAEAEQRRQLDEQRQFETHTASLSQAVTSYETQWAASDPDYQRKRPLVHDKVMALIAEKGLPATPEAAVAQVQEARKAVEQYLAPLMPRKQPVTPVTGGTGGTQQPRPTNPLEVVRSALTQG